MKSNTNKNLYAFKTILVGLSAAQVIGTVHVYLANSSLYQAVQMIQQAGYLAVPNEQVWGSLQDFGTAFRGGLFFTLSLGAGLSIMTLLGAWTWDRVWGRRKAALLIYLSLWLLAIGAVNGNGISLMSTAYMGIVPPLVWAAALLWMPPPRKKADRMQRLARFAVPVLLILIFLPLAQKNIFLDIRDSILLRHPIGRKINTFYYDYTLYAAQAFKSLEQKTVRTSRLELVENESKRSAIEKIFLSHDYLVINGNGPVDLVVQAPGDKLIFTHQGQVILRTTLRRFAANPSSILQQYSRQTDRFGPLRLSAFAAMVIGAPLCLYIFLHGSFFLLLSLFMGQKSAGFTALLLCLLGGTAIALPLYAMKKPKIDAANLNTALESGRWLEQVAALRYLELNGLPNGRIMAAPQSLLKSPHIAVRYSYVRALGSSKSPAAGKILLTALDDPEINVVCMALYSLGRRGDGSVSNEILHRIKVSDKWYVQRYGYRALRALGWSQSR